MLKQVSITKTIGARITGVRIHENILVLRFDDDTFACLYGGTDCDDPFIREHDEVEEFEHNPYGALAGALLKSGVVSVSELDAKQEQARVKSREDNESRDRRTYELLKAKFEGK